MHPKQDKPTLTQRLTKLIKQGSLLCPDHNKNQLQKCTYKLQTFENVEISENSMMGRICGGVVVQKNQQKKQLILHLALLYDNSKMFCISANKYIGFIKDYQLKADLSIFGYLNNFRDIHIGTFINTCIRRIQKRQNNQVKLYFLQTYFELFLNKQLDNKTTSIKLGVTHDNVKIPQSVLKVYQKQKMLPMNFLILYYNNYENPGLIRTFQQGLKVQPIGSMHKISNVAFLRKMSFDSNRIRFIQERKWRDEHLQLGLQCIRDGKNQDAIQCLKVAQSFDPDFIDIYIAKAVALSKMNNLLDAIKQIKQALKISPNNQRARKYYQQLQKQLNHKQDRDTHTNFSKRRNENGGYQYLHRK